MGQEQAKQLLQQGIAAAKAGRPDVARQFLQQVVRLEPQNETAWLWLSSVMAEPKERMFCLKRLLEINPQNEFALKGLRAMGIEPTQGAAPVPGTAVPVLDEAKYNRVMQAADEFLRRYNPQPPDRFDIRWSQKKKKRYNEGGTTHLRQLVYASAALVLLLLVGGIVFAATQVNLFGQEGTPVGVVNTRIPSATPLFLPTIEGPTATPFKDPMAVPATSIPAGLKAGNPYSLLVPTEIYPAPDTNVEAVVELAAKSYSIGDYEEALNELQAEREKSDPYCYSALIYYEALSLIGTRDYQEAITLLDWARNYNSPHNDWTCKNDPLMLVGLAQVWYAQDPQSQNALAFAEQALAEDTDLVQASVIKGRILLARGQVLDARLSIAQALTNAPRDVNLLLLAAEIELANNQPGSALEYVGPALYMEPALPAALYLQVDTYLRLAEQSQAGSPQQIEYYGLAVQSAQAIWLYYPGDPTGFLYLAKARIGEQNYQLAETALDRIIEVQETLPDDKQPVIREAHRLRADLRYDQGRFEDAQIDYEWYADSGEANIDILNRLVEIAQTTSDYPEVLARLEQLTALEPANPTYQLLRAKTEVEVCTFTPVISCEYRDRLRDLTDTFINSLSLQEQRADAYSYRAQAQYWDTRQRGTSLSDGERQRNLQEALNDVTQALAIRQTAVDHYFRGLILEDLEQPVKALEEYQWVDYWSQVYPYPFKNTEFDRRMAALAGQVEEIIAAQGTPEPATVTPEPEEPTQATPRPTATRPANTPVRTPTPTPTPTQPPPGPIP